MSGFKFDPSKPGLRKTLREWEELALRYVWSVGEEGATSLPICENVSEQLGAGESISRASVIVFMNRLVDQGVRARAKSRASIINFLNGMVDEGILGYEERTGKGGYHRVYYPLMDRAGFQKYITENINIKLEKILF